MKDLGSEHDWSHISNQVGMFAYTGLNSEMVMEMRENHAIYFPLTGRISVAGINQSNIDHFCQSLMRVTQGKKI